jgi:hypothetical protein
MLSANALVTSLGMCPFAMISALPWHRPQVAATLS